MFFDFRRRQCAVNNKKTGRVRPVSRTPPDRIDYFNEPLIEVNFSFKVVPRPFTAAIIASEIPAAINPYSIAVAPDSSFQKPKTNAFMLSAPFFRYPNKGRPPYIQPGRVRGK